MTKLEEYEQALRKIEKNPKDRIGTLGKVGILASGAAGGGAIVAAIGGGSIWGLTTAASWIGVTLVSAAALPVVLAGAVAGLAIAGGLAYFLNSGSKCDFITTQNMQILKKKIEEERNKLKNQVILDLKNENFFDSDQIKEINVLAQNDNGDAENRIGQIYYAGINTNQNYSKAFKWTLISAEKGNKDAQFRLSNLYRNGWGEVRNEELASFWLNKSKEK